MTNSIKITLSQQVKRVNCLRSFRKETFFAMNLIRGGETYLFTLWIIKENRSNFLFGELEIVLLKKAWPKRSVRRFHARERWRWQALTTCFGIGLTIIYCLILQPTVQEEPRLDGFLGTVWAETLPDRVDDSFDYFRMNGRESGAKPTYVFLNPGIPSSLIKLPDSKRLRNPRPLKNYGGRNEE